MAEVLLDVGVMFAAIALAGAIASQLKQSVIPFYIVAGIVLGPFVLGRGDDWVGVQSPYIAVNDFIEVSAELGIVFLLFFLGLEFSLDRLIKNKDRMGKAGTIDLLNLLVGFLIGLFFFFFVWGAGTDVTVPVVGAVLVGGIVYISSSAIITKSLIDLGWIANDESEPILGILVYEDLFIALYLAVVSAVLLGRGGTREAAFDVGIAIGFILSLLILVYYGTSFFQRILEVKSNEAVVLRAVGAVVLVAGIALALGVSEAVAAFFVGMGFSSTSHVHGMEDLLESVRDVFAAVFFFWIGLETDPTLVLPVAGLLAVAVVLTVPAKFGTAFLGGRVYGLSARRSTRVGLGMVTRGEFSLIIAALATSAQGVFNVPLITETIPAFAVAYVLVMSILGTMLMQYSGFFERRVVDIFGKGKPD
jgi:CPA2 family monovalent cation:H+ antiporter-2